RGRFDPHLRVLRGAAPGAQAPLLFRQGRRDTRGGCKETMSTLDVTIVQADLHWHDPESNLREFTRVLGDIDRKTDLIVLPEMFSTGFTMDAEANAERMDGRAVTWMADTASRIGAVVCGSLVIKDGGAHVNRMILMRPDGNFDYYDKRHLFRLAGEHQHYSSGSELVTFRLKDFRIRPL